MQPKDYIGLDVGQARTGIARASSIARLAEPLKIVDTKDLAEELKNIISDNNLSGIVVGLPRNLDGGDTAQTRWVRDWVAESKKEFDVPFHFQDEALTTKLAEDRNPQAQHLDDEAASIILQDFLDSK